jgi:hypothetical protein
MPAAVHVRRGDYVNLKTATDFHGVLSVNYYRDAMKLVSAKHPDVQFFVFSDDLKWCRENFNIDLPLTFVDNHSAYSSADLFLMKYCHHNIIANSSYSWWGAWLNQNPNKMVIAPDKWFAGIGVSSEGIYCENWIKL